MQLESQVDNFGGGDAIWHRIDNDCDKQLVFLGANGHAAQTYPFFMRRLATQYSLESMECRAVWPGTGVPPESSANWSRFMDDYVQFLKFRGLYRSSGLIHVGHSFGGSLGLMLALAHPELFDRLVIIEPGTSPTYLSGLFFRLSPYSAQKKVPMLRSTLERKDNFASREEFMAWLRTKKVYADFSEEALQDYAQGGLIEEEDGYRLRFSGAWEAHIFSGVIHAWSKIPRLKVPTLVLRGESTYLQSKADFEKLKIRCNRHCPNVELKELRGVGHMAIQENPDLVSDTVLEWLEKR